MYIKQGFFAMTLSLISTLHSTATPLADAPKTTTQTHEIMVEYATTTPKYFNQLSLPEQIFIYYFWRACLPGNRIATDQFHHTGIEVMDLFETILARKKTILTLTSNNTKTQELLNQINSFCIYLWTNHGQYFLRENGDEKRTPQRIGLHLITKESILNLLQLIKYPDAQVTIDRLAPMIFDPTIDTKLTVADNIEKSAVNIYSPDFTKNDYLTLPTEVREKINAFFYIEHKNGKRIPSYQLYSISGKYGKELAVATYWLTKAHAHAQKYPEHFDTAFIKSLEYLIDYLKTGDEELFRKHSIEWLKSNSRIDYNFGFIEVYHDPEERRGFFQAEATIKTINMKELNQLLPTLEKQMPIPAEWKRQTLGTMPNASMNQNIFGFGGLGPTHVTAAYCLPNYADIRSEYGSKQIIYPSEVGLAMRTNPELARRLFYTEEQADWLIKNDPEDAFNNDIWDLQCILHETLGHGSGRLGKHTFIEGEPLTIGGKSYKIGQTIPVTDANEAEFLAGTASSIEELRAEINALYISITHLKELQTCGFMTKWIEKFGQEKVIEWLILHMAKTGLNRILQQSDSATCISGAHAQANSVIMNYLIDQGGLHIIEESFIVNNREHTVIGLEIKDLELTKTLIKKLMIRVQKIKSTGDGIDAKHLIATYGTEFRKPEYLKILKENRKVLVGDLKATAHISPHFELQYNEQGLISGVAATWPKDIAEQFFQYRKLELSIE